MVVSTVHRASGVPGVAANLGYDRPNSKSGRVSASQPMLAKFPQQCRTRNAKNACGGALVEPRDLERHLERLVLDLVQRFARRWNVNGVRPRRDGDIVRDPSSGGG